jgi:hypothetical protein
MLIGPGMVVLTGNPSHSGGRCRRSHSKAALGKNARPDLKHKLKQKGLTACTKFKTLSSNPSTIKKKKKKVMFTTGLYYQKAIFMLYF